MLKKFFVGPILFVLLVTIFTPSTNFVRAETTTPDKNTSTVTKIEDIIVKNADQVQNFVLDHTPDFIKQSADSAIALTETFRLGLAEGTEAKKADLTEEIKILHTEKATVQTPSWKLKLTIILKNTELVFTDISARILESQVLFYGFGFILLTLLVRFVWRRI